MPEEWLGDSLDHKEDWGPKITSTPSGFRKLGTGIWTVVIYIWLTGMVFAVPIYNYQFARDNGFVTWLALGEIVPTIKGAAWPYFVLKDRSASEDQERKVAYWKAIIAVGKDDSRENDDELVGRVTERRKLMGKHAGDLLLAEGFSAKLARLKKNCPRIQQIVPPPDYRQIHQDQIALVKTEIDILERLVVALKRGDSETLRQVSGEQEKMNQVGEKLMKRLLDEEQAVGFK